MTLTQGTIHETYQVTDTIEPLETKRRLEALGLIRGTRITIVNKKKKGAVIVTIRGSRFALGYAIANGISIAPLDEKEEQEHA